MGGLFLSPFENTELFLEGGLEKMEQSFKEWVAALSKKYRQAQLKTYEYINYELISFFSTLGEEIHEAKFKDDFGNEFFEKLSKELTKECPAKLLFNPDNLEYAELFYVLKLDVYKLLIERDPDILNDPAKCIELASKNCDTFSKLPWTYYRVIIGKLSNNPQKAWEFVNKTIENDWPLDVLKDKIEEELSRDSVN